ncbi:MAG: Gldg family protein [Alphaproteobacteria bacterium]|nr:Gldg family protein [Alphaproteobacteria bacterium]
MRIFGVQYLKDFRANFSNYNAYIILAVYYVLSLFSTIYLGDYFLRESNIMNAFFVMQPIILTFVIPAITMRTWAEEIKTGTIEILLTQPIGYGTLVLTKFLASFSFFLILVASSLFLGFFSNKLSVLDLGVVVSGYCGVLLCGALFCAVGCCISIFNKNNILSYVATIFVLFAITQLKFTNVDILSLNALNFEDNFIAFLSGVLSFSNVMYFVVGTIIFLWINLLGIHFRKIANLQEKRLFSVILIIFCCIFVSIQIGTYFCFEKEADFTDEKKFTLMNETHKVLKNIDKRIDITFYESQNAREEANSSYAVFAEYCERLLKLFEKSSEGAIRVNIVMVKPFGELERRLIKDGIKYEADKLGYKKFLGLELSDNDGNYKFIKSLSGLRTNLLEADILRIVKSFGDEKKKISLLASGDDLKEISAFVETISEFYDVDFWNKLPPYIPPTFETVIVVNPREVDSEYMLALDQYLLNGGNIVMFAEKERFINSSAKPIISFLENYGISPLVNKNNLTMTINNNEIPFLGLELKDDINFMDVRSILVNNAGEVGYYSKNKYKSKPFLEFDGKAIGVISSGKYISNFLDLTFENLTILPNSAKDGKLLFVFDTDLIKDYIFVSSETKNMYFYEIVPTSDNLLFFLRLLNFVSGNNVEDNIRYRHFKINSSSIGNAILSHVKEKYEAQMQELEEKLSLYLAKKENFYAVLNAKGFASVKNLGELSEFEQIIDETDNELSKMKALVAKDYQTIIVGLTIILILFFPLIYVVIMIGILTIFRKTKQRKILEAINNV